MFSTVAVDASAVSAAPVESSKSSNTPAFPLPTEDPMVTDPQDELKAGNVAEAYGIHPDAGLLGKSGIFEKYGLMPLAGWGLVAAVSKEWLIIDEEIFLLATFLFSSTTGYIFLRQPFKDYMKQEEENDRTKLESSLNSSITSKENQLKDLDQALTTPDLLRAVQSEDLQLMPQLANAAQRNLQLQVKQIIEKKLLTVEAEENKYFSDLRNKNAEDAPKHVIEAFTTGPRAAELRNQIFEEAIVALKSQKREDNIVQPMLMDFVEKKEEEAMVELEKMIGETEDVESEESVATPQANLQ